MSKSKRPRKLSKYRIHPAWLIAFSSCIVLVLLYGTLVYGRSVASQAAREISATPSPSPTSTPSNTPSEPSKDPGSQDVHDRILAFETGWLIVDAPKRRAAVKDYATEVYLATLPTENGSSAAAKQAVKLTKILDPQRSNIEAQLDKNSPALMHVEAQLYVTVKRGNKVVKRQTIRHSTSWVFIDGVNVWMVDKDR